MITIYSKPNCPNCVKSKQLMDMKKIPYKEMILDMGQTKVDGQEYYTVEQLRALVPNAQSVPQIFDENNSLIGGYAQLVKKLTN